MLSSDVSAISMLFAIPTAVALLIVAMTTKGQRWRSASAAGAAFASSVSLWYHGLTMSPDLLAVAFLIIILSVASLFRRPDLARITAVMKHAAEPIRTISREQCVEPQNPAASSGPRNTAQARLDRQMLRLYAESLSTMDFDEIVALRPHMNRIEIAQGSCGDFLDSVAFITEGSMVAEYSNGHRIHLWPGAVIGEVNWLTPGETRAPVRIVAESLCKAISIDYTRLRQLKITDPALVASFTHAVAINMADKIALQADMQAA